MMKNFDIKKLMVDEFISIDSITVTLETHLLIVKNIYGILHQQML